MQWMGIAEFIIGPVEDRTPWLNPSDALFVRRGSLHALQPGRGFARDANREDSKGTNSSNRGFAGATVAGHFSRAGPPLGHLRPVLGHLGPGVGHLVQAARAVPVHLPLPPKTGIA